MATHPDEAGFTAPATHDHDDHDERGTGPTSDADSSVADDGGGSASGKSTHQPHRAESVSPLDIPSPAVEPIETTQPPTQQDLVPRAASSDEESQPDIWGAGDSSRQGSSVGDPESPAALSTRSAQDAPEHGWLSSSDLSGPGLESLSSTETETPEAVDPGSSSQSDWPSNEPPTPEMTGHGSNSQSDWTMASAQSSIAAHLDPSSDVEDASSDPSAASGSAPGPLPIPHNPEPDNSTAAEPPLGDRSPTPSAGMFQRPQSQSLGAGSRRQSDLVLPRWQPDAEVTYCPICHTQFSFFVRKHHCRKCGRVVCNSCSPHRIIIPYQYIVRPPGFEISLSQSLFMDSLEAGYVDLNGIPGGERVRLCNPCVPDPNTAPPQGGPGASPSALSPSALSPRSSHQRSRSSIGNAYAAATSTNRYGMVFPSSQGADPFLPYGSRSRRFTLSPSAQAVPGPSTFRSRPVSGVYHPAMGRYSPGDPSSTSFPSYPGRYGTSRGGAPSSSSHHRALPPTPQIAEEDECPICHRELPQRHLPNFESLREQHITSCIQAHSTYGSPRRAGGGAGDGGGGGEEAVVAPRRTGMYTYMATEKDCIDDAECTICLEEFTVGVPMARLECLCRFHRSCISAWFVNHPGRCPVHQHDGFGY